MGNLVISMQEDDILEIGENIRIILGSVRGGGARVCIDAPREIRVQRVRRALSADERSVEDEPTSRRPAMHEVVTRRRSQPR